MNFTTKLAIAVAEDLEVWRKLNIVAFLMSGIVYETEGIIGENYKDASGCAYSPLCIQPVVILKAGRDKLSMFLKRANTNGVKAALYIEDMFYTGYDEANRATVKKYESEALPVVGIGIRAEKKQVDKIFKGATLHN